MSGLNYSAYTRGPVDEGGLKALMSGEMQSRIQAYTVCINICKSCSEKTQNYSDNVKSCKEGYEAAYPTTEGTVKGANMQKFDGVVKKANEIKIDFRDRQALYTSAKEFYERVKANCDKAISEANSRKNKMESERDESGNPLYNSVEIEYQIVADKVTYNISYSTGSGASDTLFGI